MSSLKDAIALFQREIASALSVTDPPGPGPTWTAERVTLTLDVALIETAGSSGPSLVVRSVVGQPVQSGRAEAPVRGHAIRIEFSVRPEGGVPDPRIVPGRSAGVATPARARGDGRDELKAEVIAALTELLGPPGFDSSARAAVLCDAIRGLTREEVAATAAALTRPVDTIENETVRQARHSILGIVQSGPLKSAARAETLLSGTFASWPQADLIEFVGSHWKIEELW